MSDLVAAFEKALPSCDVADIKLAPKQSLFRRDDRTEGVFFLVEGRIDLVRWTLSGGIARIHAAKGGETFAEASLYADRYHCDAVAAVESHVKRFAKGAVLTALDEDPQLAAVFARHLAATLRLARRRIELLFVTPLSDRLYLRLEELADDRGQLSKDVTIKLIAEEIGASAEATYRALAELERSGKVSRPRKGAVTLKMATVPRQDLQRDHLECPGEGLDLLTKSSDGFRIQ